MLQNANTIITIDETFSIIGELVFTLKVIIDISKSDYTPDSSTNAFILFLRAN